MAKNMIGFDIGSSTVKIVCWNGRKVTAAISVDTPENLVKDGVIASPDAMADFIKTTLKENKIRGKNCAVVLPSTISFLRRITLPAMSVQQLAVNLPYEFRDFLTMEKDRYFYDYALYDLRRGEDGKPVEMELIAAAAPKETIEQYRAMFERAGLQFRTAVPVEGLYSNLLARLGGDKQKEYAILNLGHSVTRLDIFTGSHFEATRVCEIGLDALDRTIADQLGVDLHIAHTYQQSNYQDVQNSDYARGIYAAIATEVRKAVNFYSYNNRVSELRDVWVCGGGAGIPAMCAALGEYTGMIVHPVSELLPNVSDAVRNPDLFAAAIGAAIQ